MKTIVNRVLWFGMYLIALPAAVVIICFLDLRDYLEQRGRKRNENQI